MILAVCLFLVLCVLGINLLNAANAKTMNTSYAQEQEQTMLYVSSVYDIVNEMVESGAFSDAAGRLPAEVSSVAGFYDDCGKEIGVKLRFVTGTLPIKAQMDIIMEDGKGMPKTYTVSTVYSGNGSGTYRRESCKGLLDQ